MKWKKCLNKLLRGKNPEAFLLGILGTDIAIEQINLFMYGTTVAWMVYSQKWKEDIAPTVEDWQTKLMEYAEMTNLTNRFRDQEEEVLKKERGKSVDYLKFNCKQLKMLGLE